MLHRSPYAFKTELLVGTLILWVHLLFGLPMVLSPIGMSVFQRLAHQCDRCLVEKRSMDIIFATLLHLDNSDTSL